MGYFWGIFAFANREVGVYKTGLSAEELARRLHSADEGMRRPYGPAHWALEYAPGLIYDAWENYSNGKLYLTEAQAYGDGMRSRRKLLALIRRTRMAECSRKRRKRRQYYIED